ncbi:hypothetical protein DTL42_20050 [Bremerella cremea]|uniref:Cadherin domain protein n=1 Tax=Bremerella cremea TaxID=1031537 RepID=A0A368KNW8_9BACT|nr:cadherin domain-containing protein [Bremerella cremea]RCS42125.1 hypothetical protein DTL42_20050 [Bremerella cremea]
MKNIKSVRKNLIAPKKSRNSVRDNRAMRLESLEIRDLLAANTLDFVDNLEIGSPGETRDLQLEVDAASGSSIVALRIKGTSGNLNPDVPLVFIQDTDRTNPANHVPLLQAMGDIEGTSDSYILFQVNGGDNFTIQVGGSGSGGFIAEIMQFGSTDADQMVTEQEYYEAVAAELQARGAGNHNTAAYFQTVWGIDFNQPQYDPGFDANFNGIVEGFELSYMESAMGQPGVVLDLIGDNEAPVATAKVAVDTGISATDNITNDIDGNGDNSAIVGTITDFSKITKAIVKIDGKATSIDLAAAPSINAITVGDNEITFGLSIADLDALLGSSVVDSGSHTLTIETEDELGNTSITPFSLVFQFDTTAPNAPTGVDLAAESDSGTSNTDNITNDTTPTISVTAEAGTRVTFSSSSAGVLGTVVANESGVATITPTVGLAEGNHTITATSTDAAGNVSSISTGLIITIDTINPASFTNLTLGNATTNPNLTDQSQATFTGTSEANAIVELLDLNSAVIATTTADASGNFSFTLSDNVDLDFDINNFTFRATDAAGNQSSAVFVVYRNTAPSIDAGQLFSVDENSANGTTVGNVSASGNDTGDVLSYAITGIDSGYEGAFVINASTGVITVGDSTKLNYEDKTSFTLTIQVTDSYGDGAGGEGLATTQTVTINLNDVNEEPTFDQQTYTFSVEENSAASTSVGTVTGSDVDADDTSLTYGISGGSGDGLFAIDSATGAITVASGAVLDFETTNSYTLDVTLTDSLSGGEVGQVNTVTKTITINLIDVNEDPEFVGEPITLSVAEDAGENGVVGTISATDVDADDSTAGDLTFGLATGGTGDGLFAIDPTTGEITITALGASTLDFETTTSYTLNVTVTDNLDGDGAGEVGAAVTKTTSVTINILDANEAPEFVGEPISFTLPEDAAIDDSVGTVAATDVDADDSSAGDLTYGISGGTGANYFQIDPTTGEITVKDNSVFDFESTTNSFTLNVTVTDNLDGDGAGEVGTQKTTTTTVTIDLTNVNELPTVPGDTLNLGLVRWTLVDEAGEVGNTVKVVGLVDPEMQTLTYTDSSGNAFFHIDSAGNLILDQAVTAGDLTEGELEIVLNNVLVSDGIDSKTISITFKVVENSPPEFTSPAPGTTVSVDENLVDDVVLNSGDPIDDTLVLTATDLEGDNPLVFSVAPSVANPDTALAALFSVAEVNGNWTVVVADPTNLNFNYVNQHGASNGTFTIDLVVTDALGGFSTQTLEITVADRNDTPTFTDPGTLSLDEYVAKDPSVSFGTEAGTVVFDASTAFADADLGDTLTYTLDSAVVTGTSTDISGAFTIDPNTGIITVLDPTLLNAEGIDPDSVTLTITANDGSGESNSSVSGNLNIDIVPQDELPIYVSPTDSFDVRYRFVDGADSDDLTDLGNISEVLTVADPEGDTITYSQRTTGASGEEYFALASDGSITSIKQVDFTEDEMTFELVFDYSDGELDSNTDLGFSSGFVLTIRVFKNPPAVFDQASYDFSLDENTAASSTVVQTVSATDPDGENVTYAINDPSGTFAINATTGEIIIANAAALNYEANSTLSFTVTAIDEAANETDMLVTVTLNDLNEAPTITNGTLEFGINEDTANGAAVGTVTATDPDADDTTLSYQITGGTGQGVFAIDAGGNITVADASQIDFETNSSYTLQVQVTDNGGPTPGSNLLSDTKTFTINIGDVNEAPVLTGAAFDLPVVDESNLTATEIGTVGDDYYTKVYSNATYNFRGQFTDPEGDALTLSIANKAAIEALDYVSSINYDNATDELTIVFVHYGVAQNRAPFTIQLVAQETASGMLTADAPLEVGVSVTNQKAVDFKLIPVSSPTDSSQAFAGISEGQLPGAINRIADGQTFTVEIWGTTLVGQDDVTPGNSYIEGFSIVNLALLFNSTLLTTSADNVAAPLKLGGGSSEPITVDNTTGQITNFSAFFGFDELPSGVASDGNKGEYVRLGYVTLTARDGVSTSGMTVNDLLSIDYSDANTSIVPNAADANEVSPAPAQGDPVPRHSDIQQDVIAAQANIESPGVEIVDATTFTISSGDSLASLLVGTNGSTIDGNSIAAQSLGGETTSVSGKLFVIFTGDAANPTSMEIIGSELIFADSGSYSPGEPNTAGGNPDSANPDPANFGVVTSDSSSTTKVAIRETILRTSSSQVINLTGNASSGGATFNSQGIDLEYGSGFADINVFIDSFGVNQSVRHSLASKSVVSRGAENSMLVGDGVGGFTLTLDLKRILLDEVLPVQGQITRDLNLLLNATIVAEINGGANLSGSVFKQDNQPLEDGSGVFVTVNKSRTQLDTNGQVSELPQDAQWASEWDTLWVEVWGNTADALGVYGGSLDLAYNSDLFTATAIEYAPSMGLNQTGTIDTANGKIVGLGSASESSTLGKGAFVLLGRVKLESLPTNGVDVTLDDYHSESLGLVAENVSLGLTGVGMTEVSTDVADVDVWGVAFDVNNDGRIGLADFSQFVQAFGKSSLHSNDALVAALDFDNNGSVGLSDFSYFAQNFGKGKDQAASLVYPETFTQSWVGRKIELDGPNSVEDVFNQALTDWQTSLGLEEPIDVKLVVTDYGDAQLGEAQLVAVDENGLPSYGILTLDDDGAGLGWSSDLAGGPAEGQYDLYTVILHELGHLYGFMAHYSGFADNIVTDYNGGKVFMGADFVATLDDYGFHLDETENPGDVMNDTLDPGVRKTISDLDVQILLTAYASASSESTVASGTAALHTEALHAQMASSMIVDNAPVASVTEAPISFVYDKVVDVETVSGRTGYQSMIVPAVFDELVRNGIRVTTSSSTEVQQQMDDIDSAVADFMGEDSALLVADAVEDVRSFSTEDDSTNVDDLFADWDVESDLEG